MADYQNYGAQPPLILLPAIVILDRSQTLARTATILSRKPLGLLALCLIVGEAMAGLLLSQHRSIRRSLTVQRPVTCSSRAR